MSHAYYVAVTNQGRAELAATKQSVVVETAAASGAEVVRVNAPNAFLARREALADWGRRHGLHQH
jgi:hypothetical protein